MINESYPILNQKYYLQDPSRYKDNHQPKIKQEALSRRLKSSVSFITRTSSDLLTTAWVN